MQQWLRKSVHGKGRCYANLDLLAGARNVLMRDLTDRQTAYASADEGW